MSETGPHNKPAGDEPVVVEGEIVDDGASSTDPTVDYTDTGVPTFDYVRERIENRNATSTGAAELAADPAHAKSLDEQLADRDRAGRDKLEQIRRSMRGE